MVSEGDCAGTVRVLHNSRERPSHRGTPKVMQCSASELAASCLSAKAASRSQRRNLLHSLP